MTTAQELPSLFRADSLAEQAYRAIREGIATGLFSAGERVTERGLAARLDVSATPVREALRRLEQEGLIERVSARQLRVVDHSSGTLRELLLAGAVLRALEARIATHKITEAALDRMAAIVEAQSSEQGIDIPERLRIAREFDMEIERAADNPTLRSMILSLSIIGQERRARSLETLRMHPEMACAGSRATATYSRRSAAVIPTGWSRSSAARPLRGSSFSSATSTSGATSAGGGACRAGQANHLFPKLGITARAQLAEARQ